MVEERVKYVAYVDEKRQIFRNLLTRRETRRNKPSNESNIITFLLPSTSSSFHFTTRLLLFLIKGIRATGDLRRRVPTFVFLDLSLRFRNDPHFNETPVVPFVLYFPSLFFVVSTLLLRVSF